MRKFVFVSISVAVLAGAPLRFASADDGLSAAIKRDSKTVGATFKEGAHHVAAASKAVAHTVAQAAKQGASETRDAFKGKKPDTHAK